ncbi:MAG: hypothetical protein NC093_03530 [Alistipes sp.]|nr:hypothetical protein [Alistipes sp.]
MKKKDLIFTLGLTLLMGVIWILGELVMGLWVAVIPSAHIFWLVGIVLVTLMINVWHSFKEDESGNADAPKSKYERKAAKRKSKKK